jgi:arginyl-tRNA synthetase
MYLEKIRNKINKILNQKYNNKLELKQSNKFLDIDFYLPLFEYHQKTEKSIEIIFQEIKQNLILIKEIKNIFLEKFFLNIQLNKSLISKKILYNVLSLENKYGQKKNNNKIIVLDYSSPNIAKNFSIGHLRSTVIGNALKNIYKKLGFKTISINYLGDWGMQFAKMILAYKKWGNKEVILRNPISELQKIYILFHEKEKENSYLKEEARTIFKKLENKDKDEIKLWKWFKQISLKEFHKIYKLLNISFDHITGESFFHKKAIQIVNLLKKKGLIVLDQDAYIMPLEENTPPALIQKKNGSYLYLTREIACVLYRYKKFKFNKILYVVGNEQKLHFQQLNQIFKKMGYNLILENINFGLILANNKKISTRKNNEYNLLDIIQQTQKKIKKKIQKKNIKLKEFQKISEKIAIGAIIFNDLKNDRHLDIDFNLDNMLKFEGNTGPYLQYTVVRFNSIIKKNTQQKKIIQYNWDKIIYYFEKSHYFQLIKIIDQFTYILEQSQKKNMPSILARYLLQLAKNANSFYAKEKILVQDPILKDANFLLIKALFIILKEGLNILGIPILEKM